MSQHLMVPVYIKIGAKSSLKTSNDIYLK